MCEYVILDVLTGGACLKFPKLKHTILCSIILVFLPFLILVAGVVAIWSIDSISEQGRAFISIGFGAIMVVVMIKNLFDVLFITTMLDTYRYHQKARKWFALPQDFDANAVKADISSFGQSCEPVEVEPSPEMLQYHSKKSITVNASAYEKVVCTYTVDILNKDTFNEIVKSARKNSLALRGHRTHHYLGNDVKNAPLNRVTIAIVFVQQVANAFRDGLLDAICKLASGSENNSLLACVVDFDRRICIFDSMNESYSSDRPAKNRGISLIKKFLFNNKLTYENSTEMLDPVVNFDPEQSLWEFWRNFKKETSDNKKDTRAQFEKMSAGDIVYEDDLLYLMLQKEGVVIFTEKHEDTKTMDIEPIEYWNYPKAKKISGYEKRLIKQKVDDYFQQLGYTTNYISYDE